MIVSNTYHISDAFIEMPRMYQGISCLPTMNMQDPTCFSCRRSRSQPQKAPNENGPTHGLRKFPDPDGTGIVLPTIITYLIKNSPKYWETNQPTLFSHGFRMRCIESTVATIPPKGPCGAPPRIPCGSSEGFAAPWRKTVPRCVRGKWDFFSQTVQIIRFVLLHICMYIYTYAFGHVTFFCSFRNSCSLDEVMVFLDSERFLVFSCFHVFFNICAPSLTRYYLHLSTLSHFQSEPGLPGMEETLFERHQVRPLFFCSTLPLLSGGRDFASTGTLMAIRNHEKHLEGQNDRVGWKITLNQE